MQWFTLSSRLGWGANIGIRRYRVMGFRCGYKGDGLKREIGRIWPFGRVERPGLSTPGRDPAKLPSLGMLGRCGGLRRRFLARVADGVAGENQFDAAVLLAAFGG